MFYIGFNILLESEYMYYLAQINYRIFENYEIYRLISAMFLHADVMHIFSNMVALLIFGAVVELSYSKVQFLIIYFISGLIGNIFSLFLLSPYTMSLGAAFIIIGLDEDKTLIYLTLVYLAYFLLTSFQPGINLWAHLFGLAGGLGLGYLFHLKKGRLKEVY